MSPVVPCTAAADTTSSCPAVTRMHMVQVASPVGVPAGPLLDSKWTTLAANLGFDIVTYKTIRSQASTGHDPPNVLYLHTPKAQLPAAGDVTPLQVGSGRVLPVLPLLVTMCTACHCQLMTSSVFVHVLGYVQGRGSARVC